MLRVKQPPLGNLIFKIETKSYRLFCPKSLSFRPSISVETAHPTTFCLNTTIHSLLGKSQPGEALLYFLKWQKQGLNPDRFTLPSLIKLSVHLPKPSLHGECLHAFALKSGYMSDIFITTGLVEAYFKYGYFCAPRQLFTDIPNRDVVFFTAIISGFAQNGLSTEALDFLSEMLKERITPNRMTIASVLSACSQLGQLFLGKILHAFSLRYGLLEELDVIIQTAFLDMYAKCDSLGYMQKIFDRMRVKNLASWSVIISSYVSNGSFRVALTLFRDMVLEGCRQPRSSTLALVLKTCAVTTDLRKGKEVHGYILRAFNICSELDSLIVGNAIIDMYANTGNLVCAVLVFKTMPKRNIVTWTTMILGYGAHGLCKEALHAFKEMKDSGIRPDGVAFLSVLSACSHGGLVDEGRELYFSMLQEYNTVPEIRHFVCMVDLYGRAGLLREAFDFIKAMPIQPSKILWGTLLSSCRNHKNVELGEYAAKKAMEIDGHDIGNYVLLSRLYADAGRWDDVAEVRVTMKKLGLRPNTACSWVDLKGRVYRFTVGDRLNAFSTKMYEYLDKLVIDMEKAGFKPGTLRASHKIDEKQVRDLCCHTEKLALAFMLMELSSGGLIRIWKNLRVCRDCHETFKYVSMTCQREIILKDPNRYHRFQRGGCSCHDYW